VDESLSYIIKIVSSYLPYLFLYKLVSFHITRGMELLAFN